MPQPLVTLTTDFGLADHFVGALKGVILSIEPRTRIVDITHEITPYAIAEAAFVVAQAAECFPRGSVHVVVVDPGVGTARRPVLAEAAGQHFVAPDNGVLSLVYARHTHKVRAVTAERFFRHPISRTFHGRDVFAPVAAHMARGVAPARFGKLVSDYVRGDFASPVVADDGRWTGHILKVDRFGNLITNFEIAQFRGLETGSFELRAGRKRVRTLGGSYAEGKAGELFLIAGSAGYWEIAVKQKSAAQLSGCAAGDEIRLALR